MLQWVHQPARVLCATWYFGAELVSMSCWHRHQDSKCRCEEDHPEGWLIHVLRSHAMCFQAFVSCLCSRKLRTPELLMSPLRACLGYRCLTDVALSIEQKHYACRRCRARPQPWPSSVANGVHWSLASSQFRMELGPLDDFDLSQMPTCAEAASSAELLSKRSRALRMVSPGMIVIPISDVTQELALARV